MASEHLRLMQRCGFLSNEREGRKAYYRIVETHLASIIACIESRFGERVTRSVIEGPKTLPRSHSEFTSTEKNHERYYHFACQAGGTCRRRPEDRTHRRSHAGRIPRSPFGDRPQCSLGSTRSQGPDASPQRIDSEPLYVICKSGGRSRQACEKFIKAGFTNVVNVEGGTTACIEAGLPVVRGKKAISLERQVRIAAGSLVLLGAIGSYAFHPALIWLSAFVGAGLVFAGITDTCGMGMLLARMPWNQCSTSKDACA